jgi:uncharacterized protein YjbI with pentapeptide repeats
LSPDPHHSEILRSGPKAWNAWREKNPNTVPDLTGLSLTSSERQLGPTHGGPLNLKAAGLRESHLRFATLSTADLQAADMSGADLMHAQLDQANLSAVNLSNARLDHADFAGATLTKVNLCGASLRFATLSTADLQAADMSGADLMHARLDHANLSAANLTDACLDYADFAGVNLSKVNLCGASLQHAKNLTQSQIKESTGSASTILPPHLQGSVPWSPARNATIDLRPLPRLTAEVNVPHINSRNVQRWRVGAFFICVALVITAFVWQHMNETLTETNASLDAGDQGLRQTAPEALTQEQAADERQPTADPELPPMPSGASTVDQTGSSPKQQAAPDTDKAIVSRETNASDNAERSKAFGPNEHVPGSPEEGHEPASSEPSEAAALVSAEAPADASRHAIVPDLPFEARSPRHGTTNPQSTPTTEKPAEPLAVNTPESSAAALFGDTLPPPAVTSPLASSATEGDVQAAISSSADTPPAPPVRNPVRLHSAKGQNIEKPGARAAISANGQTALPSNAENPPKPIRNPTRQGVRATVHWGQD